MDLVLPYQGKWKVAVPHDTSGGLFYFTAVASLGRTDSCSFMWALFSLTHTNECFSQIQWGEKLFVTGWRSPPVAKETCLILIRIYSWIVFCLELPASKWLKGVDGKLGIVLPSEQGDSGPIQIALNPKSEITVLTSVRLIFIFFSCLAPSVVI